MANKNWSPGKQEELKMDLERRGLHNTELGRQAISGNRFAQRILQHAAKKGSLPQNADEWTQRLQSRKAGREERIAERDRRFEKESEPSTLQKALEYGGKGLFGALSAADAALLAGTLGVAGRDAFRGAGIGSANVPEEMQQASNLVTQGVPENNSIQGSQTIPVSRPGGSNQLSNTAKTLLAAGIPLAALSTMLPQELIWGTPESTEQVQLYTPEQQQFMNQQLQSGQGLVNEGVQHFRDLGNKSPFELGFGFNPRNLLDSLTSGPGLNALGSAGLSGLGAALSGGGIGSSLAGALGGLLGNKYFNR